MTATDPRDPASPVPSVNPVEVKIQEDLWRSRRWIGYGGYVAGTLAIPANLLICEFCSDAAVARVVQLQGVILGLGLPLIALAATYLTLNTIYGANRPPTLGANAPNPQNNTQN